MHTALTMTISILKLRIGSFVALAALVGILSAEGGMGWGAAVAFTLAVLGASGAAGAFNQYFERETDRLMARTHTRPFACGTLKAATAPDDDIDQDRLILLKKLFPDYKAS